MVKHPKQSIHLKKKLVLIYTKSYDSIFSLLNLLTPKVSGLWSGANNFDRNANQELNIYFLVLLGTKYW
jgi:hypothetical protein